MIFFFAVGCISVNCYSFRSTFRACRTIKISPIDNRRIFLLVYSFRGIWRNWCFVEGVLQASVGRKLQNPNVLNTKSQGKYFQKEQVEPIYSWMKKKSVIPIKKGQLLIIMWIFWGTLIRRFQSDGLVDVEVLNGLLQATRCHRTVSVRFIRVYIRKLVSIEIQSAPLNNETTELEWK